MGTTMGPGPLSGCQNVHVHTRDQDVAALLAEIDTDAVGREIFERLRTLPTYSAISEDEAGDVLAALRRNLELVRPFLVEGRAPAPDDVTALQDSARRRAAEGVPLEDMLHAYRIGARVMLDRLAAHELAHRHPEAVVRAAAGAVDYIDLVTAVVVQSYLDERVHLTSEQERRARALLDRLATDVSDDADSLRLADHLGFELGPDYTVFAVLLPDRRARDRARLAADLRAQRVLALTVSESVLGLAAGAADLARLLSGCDAPSIAARVSRAELAGTIEDVTLLAGALHTVRWGGERRVEDLVPELLLARAPRVAARLRQTIVEDLPAELGHTLTELVANQLDRNHTAEGLGIHRNTLANRLARVRDSTGWAVDEPRGAMLAQLAVLAGEI